MGNGSQACHFDCQLPVSIRPKDSEEPSVGHLQVPAVTDSELPGLLGLTALRKNRAVLDFTTLRMHFCGPNDYDVEKALPEGTDTFQLEVAPSGHLVLPCCEFKGAQNPPKHSLTLLSRQQRIRGNRSRSSPPESNRSSANSDGTAVPPPPAEPPILPRDFRRREDVPAPPARSS